MAYGRTTRTTRKSSTRVRTRGTTRTGAARKKAKRMCW